MLKKLTWKRSRPLLQKLAIAYGLICFALYFQQQVKQFIGQVTSLR